MELVPITDLAELTRCQVLRRKPPHGESWEADLREAQVGQEMHAGTVVYEAGYEEAEGFPLRVLTRDIHRKIIVRLTNRTRTYFLRQNDILLPMMASWGNLGKPVLCLSKPPQATIPAKTFYLCRAKQGVSAAWLYFMIRDWWTLETYAKAANPEQPEAELETIRSKMAFSLRMTTSREIKVPRPQPGEVEFAKKAHDFLLRREQETMKVFDELSHVFSRRSRLAFMND